MAHLARVRAGKHNSGACWNPNPPASRCQGLISYIVIGETAAALRGADAGADPLRDLRVAIAVADGSVEPGTLRHARLIAAGHTRRSGRSGGPRHCACDQMDDQPRGVQQYIRSVSESAARRDVPRNADKYSQPLVSDGPELLAHAALAALFQRSLAVVRAELAAGAIAVVDALLIGAAHPARPGVLGLLRLRRSAKNDRDKKSQPDAKHVFLLSRQTGS